METIHKKMSQSYQWYQDWHSRSGHEFVQWLTLALVAITAFSVLSMHVSDWMYQMQYGELVVTVSSPSTAISLSPPTDSVKNGDTFAVNILLNTNGGPIDAIDVYSLHYDPTILKVVDDLESQKGVQILPGDLFPNTAINVVDESMGRIKFAQFSNGGQTFQGRGVLATIHFKAVGIGKSYLNFDFNRGSTIDTNAAHRGKDKLSSVVDGIYTVTAN